MPAKFCGNWMNLWRENYQTLPATGLKEEFFAHALKLKIMFVDLVAILEKPVIKFKWKNSKCCPIYCHVHHKWLAIFATKPIKDAGMKKMTPLICFTTMSWSVPVPLWGSVTFKVSGFPLKHHFRRSAWCSSSKQTSSKFCGN